MTGCHLAVADGALRIAGTGGSPGGYLMGTSRPTQEALGVVAIDRDGRPPTNACPRSRGDTATMNTTAPIGATIPGYPRIGPNRELKRALESYWSGESGRAELEAAARTERERTWRRLAELGLDSVPSNTFSLYDQVLDAALL